MSFKVGDWVYYDGSVTPTQILSIGANFIYMSNQYTTGKDGTSLKLWQPQMDGWYWFYDDDETGEGLTLGKFKGVEGDYYKASTEMKRVVTTYLYCQPFIGALPSWCKE